MAVSWSFEEIDQTVPIVEPHPEVDEEPPTKKRKQDTAAKRWCFTWNNYPDDWQDMLKDREGLLDGYIAGREKGSQGTPHIQGWVEFPKKNRWTALKLPKQIHWEVARGSDADNYKYCTKDGDFVTYGTGTTAKPYVYMLEMDLSPWQQRLVNILIEPINRRKVYWVWEPMGKAGKTTLQKWFICRNKNTIVLSGKAADMKNCVLQYLTLNKRPPRTVMINIPRSLENKYVSYTGLEEIKDMLFYSGKYEGGMVNEEPPHMVIFANTRPDTFELSGDRWNIIRIPDGKGEGAVVEEDWQDLV